MNARAEICLGCWRDRPFLNSTHLILDEVFLIGRQVGSTTGLTKIASALECYACYSHYTERLAKVKQVPFLNVLARPDRDPNHAELRPTRHEESALTLWSHFLLVTGSVRNLFSASGQLHCKYKLKYCMLVVLGNFRSSSRNRAHDFL